MRYNGTNVPSAGATNEPPHEFFTRQLPSDYFFAWKYNADIDNIWALSQKLPPFWIAGCNISFDTYDTTYYYYSIGNGFVFSKGLVYVQEAIFTTPLTDNIYVVRIDKDGVANVIDINSYSYDIDMTNGLCKIGYVCKGVIRIEPQNYFAFLKNAPFRQYVYDALNFYNGYGRYQ